MASAAENRPNRNGPPEPCLARQSCQMATMRRTSAATGLSSRPFGLRPRNSMGQCSRSAWNPECISAETLRASARAAAALGHRAGWSSASSSMIARLSQTTRPPPTSSAGTLPEGECSRTCPLASGARRSMLISSKAMPARRMASQGRRLQLDVFLLPMTSLCAMRCSPCSPSRRRIALILMPLQGRRPICAPSGPRSQQVQFHGRAMTTRENTIAPEAATLLVPADNKERSVPVWIVRDAAALREAPLTEAQRAWIEAAAFKGGGNRHLLIPGDDGALAGVAFGIGETREPMARPELLLGVLASALPAGLYHVASGVEDAELAAVAWGLGAYRFRRYKTGDREGASPPPRLKMGAGSSLTRALAAIEAVWL